MYHLNQQQESCCFMFPCLVQASLLGQNMQSTSSNKLMCASLYSCCFIISVAMLLKLHSTVHLACRCRCSQFCFADCCSCICRRRSGSTGQRQPSRKLMLTWQPPAASLTIQQTSQARWATPSSLSCCTVQDTHQLFIATITSWVLTCHDTMLVPKVCCVAAAVSRCI